MKTLHLIRVLNLACALCLGGCNDSSETQTQVTAITDTTKTHQEAPDKVVSGDSAELTAFIRDVYKWKETKSSPDDFYPKSDSKDSSYIGIDWVAQAKRQKELEATNFFSKEFLDNYNNIATTIDKRLKDGSFSWLVGDLPPFGNDTNPWCNCQDSPDDYWKIISVSNIKTADSDVSFRWSFDNQMFYRAVASKASGSWKVKYLQGFDYKEFLQ